MKDGGMKPDEMQILKAASIKLNDDTIFILTQQYHTEQVRDEFTGKTKTDRTKSKYQMRGYITKIDDLKNMIKTMMQDANRLEKWYWPGDKDFTLGDNYFGASFLSCKLKKALPWEIGSLQLQGHVIRKKKPTGDVNLNAVYKTDDYICDNGDVISALDKDALLAHVGQTIRADLVMKSKIK